VRRILALPLVAWLGCSGLPAVLGGAPPNAWELPPPPPSEAPIAPVGALERFELPNGLRGIGLRDKRIPHVVVGLSVRRGAAIEPLAHAGLAGYTAELMERGAGDRDVLALAELVDGLGASLSVGADWDSMTITVSGLSRDTDTLFEVLRDVALRPRFDPAEADKARSEALAALEKAKDEPRTLIGWHAARAVFEGHRFGIPLGGNIETVGRLDAALAREFHRRLFVASNAVVFAAGDFEHADLVRRAREAFGSWASGEAPAPVAPPSLPAPPARRIVVVDKPDLGQARIAVAHEGLTRVDPRRTAAGLMNAVLGGGGFNSRLMKRVRSDEGLTYGVYSGFGLRRATGPFVVDTFTKVPAARQTLDLVLSEIERMQSQPPEAKELAEAKSLQVGSFALGLETSARVVGSLVDLDVYGLPEDSLDTFRARVREVTREQVAGLATELLHPDRAAIVVLGPAETLVPQLEDLGQVEVVQP
jgi:predicted Zn-dependent peptidase